MRDKRTPKDVCGEATEIQAKEWPAWQAFEREAEGKKAARDRARPRARGEGGGKPFLSSWPKFPLPLPLPLLTPAT